MVIVSHSQWCKSPTLSQPNYPCFAGYCKFRRLPEPFYYADFYGNGAVFLFSGRALFPSGNRMLRWSALRDRRQEAATGRDRWTDAGVMRLGVNWRFGDACSPFRRVGPGLADSSCGPAFQRVSRPARSIFTRHRRDLWDGGRRDDHAVCRRRSNASPGEMARASVRALGTRFTSGKTSQQMHGVRTGSRIQADSYRSPGLPIL